MITFRFSDKGADINSAIDWFFMGEFFVTGTKKSAFLMDARADDGYLKGFVSSLAQERYDLTEDTSNIHQLLKIGPSEEDQTQGRSVFQGSTGSLIGGEIVDSIHSVTIAGVIINPDTEVLEEQFKAIILIDSDNDAVPSEEESVPVAPVTVSEEAVSDGIVSDQKAELKAMRLNSYTIYPLRYIKDRNNKECWEIVGYSDPAEAYWEPEILYSINELLLPSDTLIESLWEENGSLDHMNDPDLTLDTLFMTEDQEGFTDPYVGRINESENAIVTEFAYGAAVRLNYFVSNRSEKSIELEAEDGVRPSLTWKVIRGSDGTTVAEGIHLCELPIRAGYECGSEKPNLITINEYYGQILPLEPGEYMLIAEINPDHDVREAYYRNNLSQILRFTVLEDTD